jgi:glycosyltransferase involved in cell wall biosynthesis
VIGGTGQTKGAPPVVVQVVLSLGRGGLETMAADLAVGLRARGFRPAIIALDEGGVQESMLTDADIPYYVIGGRRIREWGFHRSLAALLRRLHAQVVHTHMFAPLIHMLPAITMARIPRVVHTEHSFEYLAAHASNRRIFRWVSRSAKVFSLVGERMLSFYADTVGVSRKRLCVIPNGVDVDRYQPQIDNRALRAELGIPASAFVVGTAGRLSPEKHFQDLLSAAARARALGGNPHIVLFGEGAERGALESQAAALGLGDTVSFLGWRTELPRLLGALDVFALCSEAEGLPLALLEAMATGLPAVCTPVGDIPIIVQNDATGFLFPVGEVDAFAQHLRRLETEPDLRRRLGMNGRRLVEEKYSRTTMIDRYVNAYAL